MSSQDPIQPEGVESKVALRPAAAADEEFLFEVYASTRAEEMTRVPWSPEQKSVFVRMQFQAQKQHYAAEYPQASHDIIVLDAQPVGRLYMDRGQEKFHILDITILPRFRGSGVGTVVLKQILTEAGRSGKPVTIYIESFNPAVRLFGQLGFERVSEDGFQWLLRWVLAH